MDEEEESTTGLNQGLGVLTNMYNNYTTPEAQNLARQTYTELYSGRKAARAQQAQAYQSMEMTAVQARDALRQAREKLLAKRRNNADILLALAAGFGSPTRTGGFAENLGMAAQQAIDPVRKRGEWEQARDAQALEYELGAQDIDRKLAEAKLKYLQGQETSDTRLMSESMKVIGRETRPRGAGSGSGMSNFGKIARDEGLEPGTPGFRDRVTQLYDEDLRQRRQASGVDVEEVDPREKAALAFEYGVPVSKVDPFAGKSTKVRQAAEEAARKAGEKVLVDMSEGDTLAREAKQQAQRFLALNKRQASGPLYGLPVVGWVTGFSDAAQEMDKITAELARKQRQPGEGQVSNFDAAQFLKASLARGKNYGTNLNIGKAVMAASDLRIAQSEFIANYLAINGHLTGSKEAWNRYLESNPIFDPAKPGTFTLNKKRKEFKDWFRETMPREEEDDAPPDDDPVWAGMTPAEIAEARAAPRAFAEGGIVLDEGEELSEQDALNLEKYVRAMAQGATYNFSDEMLAAGQRGPYEENLARERAELEALSASQPLGAMGAEAVGSLPTGIGTGAAAHFAGKRLKGGKGRVSKTVAAVERLLPKSLYGKMVVGGAASGALGGMGAAQEDDMAQQAATQGVIGGILGPLGGLASKYGIGAARRGIDWLTGRGISAADEKILTAIDADDLALDEMTAKLAADRKAQVPSTLAETGGKNVEALAQAVAGKPGASTRQMVEKIEARQAKQGERVSEAINRALAPDEYYGKLDQLTSNLYTNAKPLYDAAYTSAKAIPVKDISFLYDSKIGKKALKDAIELMRADGLKIGKTDITGNVKSLGLQTLDYTKRALDDMITREEKDGSTNRGRILRKVRDKLRERLDLSSPEYRAARAQYAGDLEVLDALKLGREQFDKLAPKELGRMVKDMSYAERDALRTGVAEKLFEKIANTARGGNTVRKVLGNQAMADRLQAIFEKPADYKKFVQALEREFQVFEQSRRTLSSARSSRAANVAQGLEDTPLASAADMALDVGQQAVMLPALTGSSGAGGPWTAARMMQWVRSKMPVSERTANEVADTLGIDDPAAAKATIDRLKKEAERLQKRVRSGQGVAQQASKATAVATAPDPWGYLEQEEYE